MFKMLDYLLKMSPLQLKNTALYFNLIGFENFSKNRLIEFLIANVNHRALQQYIEPLIEEDNYFGKLLETELMQHDIEDQLAQMGLNSRAVQPSFTGYSRPVGKIHVSSQVLDSLLQGMNIGGVPVNKNMIKFKTGKGRQVKRLQK